MECNGLFNVAVFYSANDVFVMKFRKTITDS